MSDYSPLPLSLRQMQYLLAVADLGGFRRAADACHVAQPSLSAQVALAERALGVQVFERSGRRVQVSPCGTQVLERARAVVLAARDLQETARASSDPFAGTLRLGVIPTVCPYLLPEITPSTAANFPRLKIRWSEDRTARLVAAVQAGTLDGAIVALESDLGGLEHAMLRRDPFFLAGRRDHPLMKPHTPVDLSALKHSRVLLLEDGHCLRDQAASICERAVGRHKRWESEYRATSMSTLVQMVSSNDDVTLLPQMALDVENRRGQLKVRPFVKPAPGRTIVLVWRKGSAAKTACLGLAEAIRTAKTPKMRQ